MKKVKTKSGTKAYKCKGCNELYEEKKWAKRCERWFNKNNTCNRVIQKHALSEKIKNHKK